MSDHGHAFERPRVLSAPRAVIDAVERGHGSIRRERAAESGFTHAVASWIQVASGAKVFVKAAPIDTPAGSGVRIGAELADAIGPLGPPLIDYIAVGGWAVAVYEAIDGVPVTRWDVSSVGALVGLSRELRERLDPSPINDTESYAEAYAPLLGTWSALGAPDGPGASTVAHIVDRPLPYGLDVTALESLESRWFDVLAEGATALQHGDIRRDNVVRDRSGRLWLVDWTHRWVAPGWVDIVRVAPDIAADGHDPENFLRTTAWHDAPRKSVNVVLAGLASRAWRDGHLPAVPGIPHLRSMQRQQADMTLRWLATRLGTY